MAGQQTCFAAVILQLSSDSRNAAHSGLASRLLTKQVDSVTNNVAENLPPRLSEHTTMAASKFHLAIFSFVVLHLFPLCEVSAVQKAEPDSQRTLDSVVQPFLKAHCIGCHGPDKNRGEVTLHTLRNDPKDAKAVAMWERVL